MRHSLRLLALLIAIVCAVSLESASKSIREVDFKNFAYPFGNPGSPLEHWHWIPSIPSDKVALADGVHRFWNEIEPGEDRNRAPGLWVESVTYGYLDGDKAEEAIVVLNYSGGGTANWDYLYVYKLDQGAPKLIAWLESGSRAWGGLVKVQVENRLLVLDFADAKRRVGDCCSEGYIRLHYAFEGGRFVETGPSERGDLELHEEPLK
jgi:hypothetical protein